MAGRQMIDDPSKIAAKVVFRSKFSANEVLISFMGPEPSVFGMRFVDGEPKILTELDARQKADLYPTFESC